MLRDHSTFDSWTSPVSFMTLMIPTCLPKTTGGHKRDNPATRACCLGNPYRNVTLSPPSIPSIRPLGRKSADRFAGGSLTDALAGSEWWETRQRERRHLCDCIWKPHTSRNIVAHGHECQCSSTWGSLIHVALKKTKQQSSNRKLI